MIRLITGLPGSGKTYFAVHEIVKLNYSFDKEFYRFTPKSDLVIFSNIEGLKLDCILLDPYLQRRSLSIEQFFTVDFQTKIVEKYKKVVYLIDEAQKYFPKKFYNTDVFFFFQYHRHLGIDLYLITQNSVLLPTAITSLVEYEIRAVRQTNRFKNVFRYHFVSSGEIIAKKTLRFDPLIASLYVSAFSSSPVKSNPAPIRRYAFLFVFLFLVVVVAFKLFMSSFFPHHSDEPTARGRESAKKVKHVPISHPVRQVAYHLAKPRYIRSSFFPSFRHQFRKVNTIKIKPYPEYVATFTGGVWDTSGKLLFIQFDGKFYLPSEFPFRFKNLSKVMKVLVFVPKTFYHNIDSQEIADVRSKTKKKLPSRSSPVAPVVSN